MDQDKIAHAASLIRQARNVAVLTGAGISRPSGIPDFRSESGLWSNDDPMEAVSIGSFRTNPQRFYDWLRPLLDLTIKASPNPAHRALAELERRGILRAVVTQNIDDLHQRAGSQVVHELHGHMHSAKCLHCWSSTPFDSLLATIQQGGVPTCGCGGPYKPDIVFFGEALPEEPFLLAHQAMASCEVLLIAGTSLVVHPAASLPLVALQRGARLIIVNMSETDLDGYAEVVIHEDVATALPAIVAEV